MTLYKITLYNYALRNVLYVIYIVLYVKHSTRNNDILQNCALQNTPYKVHSTSNTLHEITTLYKMTLYKTPPTKYTLRKTLYTK